MTTLTNTFLPARTGLPAIREQMSAALAAWAKRRQIVRELNAHTDRELADMGLSRHDIQAVARGVHRR